MPTLRLPVAIDPPIATARTPGSGQLIPDQLACLKPPTLPKRYSRSHPVDGRCLSKLFFQYRLYPLGVVWVGIPIFDPTDRIRCCSEGRVPPMMEGASDPPFADRAVVEPCKRYLKLVLILTVLIHSAGNVHYPRVTEQIAYQIQGNRNHFFNREEGASVGRRSAVGHLIHQQARNRRCRPHASGCRQPAEYRPVTKCSSCRSMSPSRDDAPKRKRSGRSQRLPSSSFIKAR